MVNMLELAWDGFCVHTEQGWNIGKPPYGYLADRVPHPVPARRAEGRTKTRLVPDPARGPVVTAIFTWRVSEQLGYDSIADRLNADLRRYPPPSPVDPRRAAGRWTGPSVREILANPKYTGHMVWNRRKNRRTDRGVRGQVSPPSHWVWSLQPTHEPLVTMARYDEASPVAQTRQGSRQPAGLNTHPDTKRSYMLRSYVLCAICQRRMFGKTRHGHAYFACQPDPPDGPTGIPHTPRASGSASRPYSAPCTRSLPRTSSAPTGRTTCDANSRPTQGTTGPPRSYGVRPGTCRP